MNISGIFTVKKAKRSSEFLNPENLKSMTVTMNYKRNIYISGNSEIESLFTHGELVRIYIYGTLTNYKILQTNKLQL